MIQTCLSLRRRRGEKIRRQESLILVHCFSGSDRSGLAAALGILLRSDGTIAEARRQLSIYYGHNPFGKASCHDRVLDRYEEWLLRNGLEHSPRKLQTWAETVYSADE